MAWRRKNHDNKQTSANSSILLFFAEQKRWTVAIRNVRPYTVQQFRVPIWYMCGKIVIRERQNRKEPFCLLIMPHSHYFLHAIRAYT